MVFKTRMWRRNFKIEENSHLILAVDEACLNAKTLIDTSQRRESAILSTSLQQEDSSSCDQNSVC
jgi:hypothetical protein